MSRAELPEPETWADLSLYLVARAIHEDEISEMFWQALIGAYVGHDGWRTVAEALFEKCGYTAEEIVRENGPVGPDSAP